MRNRSRRASAGRGIVPPAGRLPRAVRTLRAPRRRGAGETSGGGEPFPRQGEGGLRDGVRPDDVRPTPRSVSGSDGGSRRPRRRGRSTGSLVSPSRPAPRPNRNGGSIFARAPPLGERITPNLRRAVLIPFLAAGSVASSHARHTAARNPLPEGCVSSTGSAPRGPVAGGRRGQEDLRWRGERRERLGQPSRPLRARLEYPRLARLGPSSRRDVLAGEVDDGIHPFEFFALDRARADVPRDIPLPPGLAAYHAKDLVPPSSETRTRRSRRGQWHPSPRPSAVPSRDTARAARDRRV